MTRHSERLEKRNIEIENLYVKLCKKYPFWKNDFVIEKLSDKYFISPRTIYGILSGEFNRNKKLNN